jgi:hypothetical protein
MDEEHFSLRLASGMLGGVVAGEILVARTVDTALIVRHIQATPAGIGFVLAIRLREPIPSTAERSSLDQLWAEIEQILHPTAKMSKTSLRFHVEYPDGRQFTARPPSRQRADAVFLQDEGSGGDVEQFRIEYSLAALPPSNGVIRFVCSWPARGIDHSAGELAASEVLTAARRAGPLFAT